MYHKSEVLIKNAENIWVFLDRATSKWMTEIFQFLLSLRFSPVSRDQVRVERVKLENSSN